MAEHKNGITDFIFGFFLGGVVGATTALLLAPAKGEETREFIGEKFNDAVDEGKQEIDMVRDVVRQELVKLSKKRDAVRNAFGKGVESYKTDTKGESEEAPEPDVGQEPEDVAEKA